MKITIGMKIELDYEIKNTKLNSEDLAEVNTLMRKAILKDVQNQLTNFGTFKEVKFKNNSYNTVYQTKLVK